ncbi:MAG: sulfite exporter TauE/SafE family protein [Bryobacteraceae bacterium]|jgi:uncharacterized membrane protein YfcA
MTGIELALGLAALIGIALGVLGGGGSIVTMPVLVYVAGIDPKTAVGMSLAIVGGTSLAGSYLHYREQNFHGKAAGLFGASGIVGAYFGAMLTHLVRSSVLMLSFAGLMLLVGILMLAGKPNRGGRCECHTWRCLVVGALVGSLTGFLGVGGGFLILPALVFTAGVETKKAIGSSLAIIAFNAAAGLLGQLRYIHIDWRLTLLFLIASLMGMAFGLAIVRRIPEHNLRLAFGCALLVIGGLIAYKNF